MTSFWFATVLLGFFWGGSYLAIRFVIGEAPPFSGALVRILICLFLTFLYVRLKRPPRTRIRWKMAAFLIGIFMMGIPWALLFWAEKTVLPSLAALLISAIPIFTQLLGPLLTPKDRYPARLWWGIGIGFLGVFLLLFPSWVSPDQEQLWGALAVLLVAFCYSLATLGVRRISPHISIGKNLLYQSLGATVFLIPFVLIQGNFDPLQWSQRVWFSLIYLGVCSTFIAWLLYFWMVRRYGATLASVVPYFPPVVSLLLDQIVLGKIPPLLSILGGLIILSGVYLTQKMKGDK